MIEVFFERTATTAQLFEVKTYGETNAGKITGILHNKALQLPEAAACKFKGPLVLATLEAYL